MQENTPNLDSLFEAAAQIESADERAAYLDQSCGDNQELRQQIEQLLQSDQQAGSFLERPAPGLDETILPDASGTSRAASLDAGLATAFSASDAVVIGDANHSVLKMLGNTLNEVPRVSLRESEAAGADPISRPNSPEVPQSDSDSRYRLDGEIARGGMGAIIKGRDTDLGRDLAIKVLLDSHKDKPEVIQRFVEEAQIGGQLQHPGIAPIYELGQFADQRPFFAMKLVKGDTLAKPLADREDATDERGKFLGIFEQICQTMAYAHSRGVIHRDLKPANIMVGAFGEVQVMDWGLAKVLPAGGVADEQKAKAVQQGQSIIQTMRSKGSDVPGSFGSTGSDTQMGSVMGTPAYMPPEQALGEIDLMNERADVFGLGAILCEILTGQPPYVGDDGTQIFRLASRGKLDDCFARLDSCQADDELIALAKDCLAAEPSKRPQDAGELAERVTGYLESVETKLRETQLARAAQAARIVEERKRRRVMLALAASVLLMLGLGGGGWLYLQNQQAKRITAATAKVNEALGEARLHQGLADGVDTQQEGGLDQQLVELEQARRSAQQAAELASEEAVETGLRTTAVDLLAKLERRSSEVEKQAKQAAADRVLREELELIRLSSAGGDNSKLQRLRAVTSRKDEAGLVTDTAAPVLFDDSAAYAMAARKMYAKTFRQAGLDVSTTNVTAAADWIRASAIREPLIAALDNWARLFPSEATEKAAESEVVTPIAEDDVTRSQLLTLADAADDSVWRKRLRAALAAGDTEQLEALASADVVREQSPALISWLGDALYKAEKYETAVAVLRTAQQQQPGDFFLNRVLGFNLAKIEGRQDEALGFLRASVAIRPHSAAAMVYLGSLFRKTERYAEAETAFRRAIELNPKYANAYSHRGYALHVQNKLDEAIAAYRQAIQLDHKYADTYLNLGAALNRQGQLDEAIAAYNKAIEINPKHAGAYSNLGIALRAQNKLDEAIVASNKAIELNPKSAEAYSNLGRVLQEQNKLDEAIAAYNKAIEINPKSAEAYYNLGNALYEQGQLDEAIAAYRQAIELNPKFAEAYSNLGAALRAQNKLDEAIAACNKAIEINPKHAGAYSNLGNALRAQNKLDEAIAAYRKAIELNPELAEAYSNLGNALDKQGQLDEAIAACRQAIEINPKFAMAYNNLGNALAKQGQLGEAIVAYNKAIEIDPKHASVYYNLCITLYRQGQLDEAIVASNKAIELNPKSAKAYYMLGIALERQNKLDEAIAALNKAIEIDPKDATAYASLGAALYKQGQTDEAIAAWKKVLEINPTDVKVHFNLGFALNRQGRPDEAIAAYRKAIELNPNSDAYYNLGIILAEQGKLDEAIVAYNKAIEINPKNAGAYYNLGIALNRQGRLDEAVVCWKTVIQLAPKNPGVLNKIARPLVATPDKDGKYPLAPRAAEWARQACELAPKNAGRLNTLGVALYRTEQWQEAIDALQKSIEHGADVPHNWLFLTMANWHLDEKAKAKKWNDKSLAWRETNQAAFKQDAELQSFYAEAAAKLLKTEVQPDKSADVPGVDAKKGSASKGDSK